MSESVLGLVTPSVAYLVLLVVSLVATGMALVVIFQAYRGYRRNDSRPMLYLAIGLACLTVIPFAISLLISSVGPAVGFGPREYGFLVPLATRAVEIVGLTVLLYSLYDHR